MTDELMEAAPPLDGLVAPDLAAQLLLGNEPGSTADQCSERARRLWAKCDRLVAEPQLSGLHVDLQLSEA
jgi:hypothetical protein